MAVRPLNGTTAIVTGAASGIGLALARELARAGATVVLADVEGDAVAARAREIGGSAEGRALDVTGEAAFRDVVDSVVARHGAVDLLVNNAGISMGGPTHEMTRAHWDRIIDVNLRGVVNGILAAYPAMVERGAGQIVNTASGAGLVGLPFVTGYSATKHAVVGLSTALRAEGRLHGVRVAALCPGAVETPILDREPPPDLPRGATPAVTARQFLSVVGQKPIPAERFARLALRAIIRDRHPIVVPRSARVLWQVQRASPRAAGAALHAVAKRVDRKLVRGRGT